MQGVNGFYIAQCSCADALLLSNWMPGHVIRLICTLGPFDWSFWSIVVKTPSGDFLERTGEAGLNTESAGRTAFAVACPSGAHRPLSSRSYIREGPAVITQGVIQPKRRPWRHREPGPSSPIWVEIASVSQTGQSGPDGSLREQLFIAAPSSSAQPEPSSGRRDGCWEDGSRLRGFDSGDHDEGGLLGRLGPQSRGLALCFAWPPDGPDAPDQTRPRNWHVGNCARRSTHVVREVCA